MKKQNPEELQVVYSQLWSVMKSHHISFIHAWEGIVTALRTQPNFKIHLLCSAIVTGAGYYFKISNIEWAILLFVIASGLAIELLNTSIEYTVDLLTDEYHMLAKFAKDTAAGAMLVYAFFSVIIGLLIFLPKILN
jgi:undecaprenol kinase